MSEDVQAVEDASVEVVDETAVAPEETVIDVTDGDVSDAEVAVVAEADVEAVAAESEVVNVEADGAAPDVAEADVVEAEAELAAASELDGDEASLDFELRPALEALLMVSDQPMTVVDLATFLEIPSETVETTLQELAAEYLEQGRGFELRCVDNGWRFYSAAICGDVVSRFATDGRTARLTQASLETLAVVAYKQPISRARIGAIRGVNVDGVMRTLITRGLVTETDTDPSTGAVLYGTTGFFLERMGLGSLNELPPIEDHLPDLSVLDEFIDPTAS